MRIPWITRMVSLAGLLAALGSPSNAETILCRRIIRLPATVSRPGLYCLDRNLATTAASGTAISIEADDVVLDLNGWTLDGSAAGVATNTVGIASTGHSNITVRNGTVRGFRAGIQLVDTGTSLGHVVEGIRADRNTGEGISAAGRGLRIRGNQVLNTGGSTSPLSTRGFGIAVRAPASVVADNVVMGTTSPAGSFAYGIHATGSDGLVIEGNQVLNGTTLSPAYTFGIIVPFSQDVLVANNRITRTSEGVTYSSGGTGKFRDNLTSGVTVPYSGTGTDAGNNE